MSGFLSELKRRNVIRMAGLYLVGAWLVTQVAATLLPVFEAPGWVMKTIVGILAFGFMHAMIFAWIFELTPDGLKRDSEIPEAQSIAPQTARKMERSILVLFAIALAFFGFDKFYLAPKREAALVSVATQAITEKVAQKEKSENQKSIAVLAFENRSADKNNEYFSDGVAEEILNSLAKVKDLKVAGRTSSFFFNSTSAESVQKMLPCKSPLNEKAITIIVDAIRNDKTLMAELRYWMSSMHVAALYGQSRIERATSLRTTIDAELGDSLKVTTP